MGRRGRRKKVPKKNERLAVPARCCSFRWTAASLNQYPIIISNLGDGWKRAGRERSKEGSKEGRKEGRKEGSEEGRKGEEEELGKQIRIYRSNSLLTTAHRNPTIKGNESSLKWLQISRDLVVFTRCDVLSRSDSRDSDFWRRELACCHGW